MKPNEIVRAQFKTILLGQWIILSTVALMIGIFQSRYLAYSTWAGGMCYWIPTALFLWRATAYAGARMAMLFMTAFFAGEIVKLVLSALLFLIVVKNGSADVIYSLLGLMVAIAAYSVTSVVSVMKRG